jgi:uncharacterized protein YoxC
MLFSAGNLITLAIVVIFFVVYHRLTSNNRSLEKVKRMADRLKDELSGFVDTRSEDLKHFGIELDVQQKAAKVALEKLQTAQQAIAERADSIGAISDRFKEYDDILAKLMDMTKRVDENLAHVQEEGDFADTVNRKLDSAKKSISAIERELPLLRETFAADAQKILDSFRDEILGELREGLASTSSELRAVREEAMAAFGKAQTARDLVENELKKALETATQRAASIEDSAFETLRSDMQNKLDSLGSEFDGKIESLSAKTSDGIVEARNNLSSFKAQWQSEIKILIDKTKGETASALEAAETRAKAIEQSVGKALEASENLERAVETRVTKATDELNTLLSAKKSEFDTLARAVDLRFEAASSMEASLNNSMETTRRRIEEDFAAFGQAFEGHRTRFEENFSAETNELKRAVQEMRDDLDNLRKEAFAAANEKLSGFSDELVEEMDAKKADVFARMDAWLSGLNKTVEGITEEAANRRKKDEETYALDVRKEMARIRENLFQQLDRIQRDVDEMAAETKPKAGQGQDQGQITAL